MNLLERAQTLFSCFRCYLFSLKWQPGTVQFVSKRCFTKNEGGRLACETLNYKIILASNSLVKTLGTNILATKGVSPKTSILSSFRGTAMGFTLFLFLSHSRISPKTSLATSSCQECSERTLSLPLCPESHGPVRKHVRSLGCGKHR